VRWGSFSVYGVKLHLICATNGVPISFELTPANVADVSLTEELLAEATLGHGAARRLLGDLAYRSERLKVALAEVDILLVTEPSERRRGQAASGDCHLQSQEGIWPGRDAGDHPRGAGYQDLKAKIAAYTYAFVVNRMLGRTQGHIKELWA
jgi:hypothetical protein